MAGQAWKGKYAYRLDDITEDMNWDHFFHMKEIFDRYRVCPLIGVVPLNRDPKLKAGECREDFFTVVRGLQEAGWSIAQHGYEHLYETREAGLLGLKDASEFAGVPYERQEEKLRLGKRILEENGVCAEIFMAPGHTYDENTLKALKQNGFRYVTDGYADCSYQYQGLTFIPCKSAGIPAKTGTDTICLHLNEMKEADFQEVERFIAANRKNIVDFKELLQETPLPYEGAVRRSEKRNLWKKNAKRSLVKNKVIQEYLRQNNSDSTVIKWGKRILGLPVLVGRLICKRQV